jgi:hypothetical protein
MLTSQMSYRNYGKALLAGRYLKIQLDTYLRPTIKALSLGWGPVLPQSGSIPRADIRRSLSGFRQ